jgi:hypothetical protein
VPAATEPTKQDVFTSSQYEEVNKIISKVAWFNLKTRPVNSGHINSLTQ